MSTLSLPKTDTHTAKEVFRIVATEQSSSHKMHRMARENAQQCGLKLVYERTYPPTTTDFAPIVRAVSAVWLH
jgi:hypothetical protein